MAQSNPSLFQYFSQAQRGRGLLENVFGPDFMQKQSYFTVDSATGIFNATYGRKVWHALNNQTRFWNALPRVVWGNSVGWRVRTDRGSGRSRPITETGSLPTVDISNIENVNSLPRIVGTTFGAAVKAIFTANLEGGAGDILAMEHENAEIDHVKEINEELLAGSAYLASAGATTTFTVPASVAKNFKIGDAVSQYDTSANDWDRTGGSVVSAVNTSTGVVTVANGTTFGDGDVAAIYSRAGMTSIDDIVWEDGAAVGGASHANYTANGGVRAYNLTYADRTSGTWNAGASVQFNAGTGRDLSLNLLDNAILNIRKNGGEPNLILMGHDQYFKLERLLNSQQRYMGQEEFEVGVGDERTFPGTRTGLILSTYMGIPILTDNDVPVSVSSADAVLGQNVYVLDTDAVEIAVAQPTQYVENRDYFAANSLVVRGLLYTMAELRARNIWHTAKIADLST
jgi:hypothetical protein|tara:strand:- start:3580 stop:4947 length:1368 start_codon:yes stop_codon:yes gene_type:complete